MRKFLHTCLITGLSFFTLQSMAQMQYPGIIDSTFGVNGKVTTSFNSFACVARAIAVQSDGKIVVAGESNNGTFNRFAVARYLADGTIDNQFGTGGKITFSIGTGNSIARSIAIQNDGKIIVAGNLENQTYSHFAMARLTSTGALDNQFGANGIVQTALDLGFDIAYGVAIVPSTGKIVLGGVSFDTLANGEFAVVRYNTNGTLDGGFGNSGKVRTPLGTQWDQANALAIEPGTEKIVLGGRTLSTYAMVRYNTNGTLDANFGLNGKTIYTIGSMSEVINTIYINPDGKIVAGGTTQTGPNTDMVLMRFLNNGQIDNNFGANGISLFDLGGTDIIFSIVPQGDYLVGAGSSYVGAAGDFVAMRFDTLGSLDLLFNNMIGFNITSFGNPSGANAVAIQQPDSKIILAGSAVVGTVNNFAMARYTSDFTFVGLNELNASHAKLQMMPNPASDFVAIESSTPYNRIEIKDITGKVVKVVTPGSLIRSYSLDVKNYSSGVYTATVYFDTGIKVQKFIVANSINN